MSEALDLEAVQAFVLAADFGSFTRAAEVLDTSQSAISLRISRLEKRLQQRLLDRTPRSVRLSVRGERFMPAARELLLAHERAMADLSDIPRRRLSVGISDHVAGPELPEMLSRMAAHDPLCVIEIRIAPSRDLVAAFDRGEIDAAIIRREGRRNDGEVIGLEQFGWFAAPSWKHRAGEPLRLATMAAPCGVRGIAVRALDEACLPWVEVFVGGGVMAVGAAVAAGLGLAALAYRVAPVSAVEVSGRLGLPALPTAEIVLLEKPNDVRARETIRSLCAYFRSARFTA